MYREGYIFNSIGLIITREIPCIRLQNETLFYFLLPSLLYISLQVS
jgi:hypothetical protein